MPYKYVVAVDSKGFNEAPSQILSALGRLSWATKQAVAGTGDEYLPPNELLVIGYFEGMKMGVSHPSDLCMIIRRLITSLVP